MDFTIAEFKNYLLILSEIQQFFIVSIKHTIERIVQKVVIHRRSKDILHRDRSVPLAE